MRPTDHKMLDLRKLHTDVAFGRSGGMIIWQPRIICWYGDRKFRGEELPEPFTGMDIAGIYRELGCSNRLYEQFNPCIKKSYGDMVREYKRKLSPLEIEYIIETPVGTVNCIMVKNTSNYGAMPKKWWVTEERDIKIFQWLEEHCIWKFDMELYEKNLALYGDLGAPTVFLPRVNIQNLYINLMGVTEATYALCDYRDSVEKYFAAQEESHCRLIDVLNESPVEIINFGDNIHANLLSPELFKKYVLPVYQRLNDRLHRKGKFTSSHFDGDVKALLPYVRECGFDGIEAVTPKPQGDVTLAEVREAFGDKLFLLDGIAALLFEDRYPLDELEKQTREVIELFAPRLILGISDEISSLGNLERVRFVGKIVDEYNAKIASKAAMNNSIL